MQKKTGVGIDHGRAVLVNVLSIIRALLIDDNLSVHINGEQLEIVNGNRKSRSHKFEWQGSIKIKGSQ